MFSHSISSENRLVFFGLERVPGQTPVVEGEGALQRMDRLTESELKQYSPKKAQKIKAAQDRFDKQTAQERMEADVTESIKIAMNGLNDIRDESKFEQKLRDALSAQGMNEVDITLGDVHRGGREVTVKHRLFGYTVEFRATHDETADNMKVYKSVDWKSLKGKIQTNDIVLLSRDGKSDPVVYRPKAGPGGQEHYSPTMKWAEGLQPLIPLADMDQRAADSSRVAHFVTEEDMAASQAKK